MISNNGNSTYTLQYFPCMEAAVGVVTNIKFKNRNEAIPSLIGKTSARVTYMDSTPQNHLYS